MRRVFTQRLCASRAVCVKSVLTLLSTVSLSTVCAFSAEPFSSAKVTRLQNSVSVGERRGDRTRERPAAIADVVQDRDYLLTQSGSRAELEFPDRSLVRIGQNTVFSFDADSRTLSLQKGAMLFYVPPGNGGNIKTPSLTAAITGTIAKVTENLIAVLSGELRTPQGVVRAGQAIENRNGVVRIFTYDPSQALAGYLVSWGPLPELPEIRTAQANPLFGPPDTRIFDIQELTQVNPRFRVPPIVIQEEPVEEEEEEPPPPPPINGGTDGGFLTP